MKSPSEVCENGCESTNACKYKDDCFVYDDSFVVVERRYSTHESVGDDGISRTYPGASFWYD